MFGILPKSLSFKYFCPWKSWEIGYESIYLLNRVAYEIGKYSDVEVHKCTYGQVDKLFPSTKYAWQYRYGKSPIVL